MEDRKGESSTVDSELDLNKDNFNSRLEGILHSLSIADFVAIDFELSGIPTRLQTSSNGPKTQDTKSSGKHTVQQRYEEMKAAAEKYHILQVGLTIGAQSQSGKGYFLEPHNIYLNPCILHKMDIDREVSMLSSAMQFLLSHNFNIEKPFSEGVAYLSRQEQKDAIQIESNRLDGSGYADIMLDHSETGFAEFVDETRQKLKRFLPKTNVGHFLCGVGHGLTRVGRINHDQWRLSWCTTFELSASPHPSTSAIRISEVRYCRS